MNRLRRCDACRYYHVLVENDPDDVNYGWCRRRAPKPTRVPDAGAFPMADRVMWPTVFSEDWCGEFEKPWQAPDV